MKKVVFFLFATISLLAKAQIPNHSFEDWNVVGSDTILGSNWIGKTISLPEKIFIYGQQGTVSRMAANGKNFVSISHTDSGQTGNPQYGYLYSKFAYRGRPKSFSFKGMYLPQQEGERYAVLVILTTANGDTICNTLAGFPSIEITNWSNISFNLNYTSSTKIADSCYLRFIMLPNNAREVSLSTRLFVDDLKFSENYVSVAETQQNNLTVTTYPNPVTENLTIQTELKKPSVVTVKLYNITGKQVVSKNYSGKEGSNTFLLPVQHLRNGIYTYQVQTDTNIQSGKICVAK